MNAKKILLQAARKQQHKVEIQKLTKAQAAALLRNLKKEETKK